MSETIRADQDERRQPGDLGEVELGADAGVEVRVHGQHHVVEDLPLELLQQGSDQPGQVRLDRKRLGHVRERAWRDRFFTGDRCAIDV